MVDAPKTLALSSREWNALLTVNATDLANLFQAQPIPTPELCAQLAQRIDRMRAILPGWLASVPHAAPDAPKESAQPSAQVAAQANGAAPKKGGWPKGKPRKKRNAPGIAQQQVQ